MTVALDEGGPLIAGVAGGIVTDPLDLDGCIRAGSSCGSGPTSRRWRSGSTAPTGRGSAQSPAVAMRLLYAGRESLYAEASTLIVDEEHTTPDLMALRIAGALLR